MNKALVKFLLVPQVYTVKGLAEACWCVSERMVDLSVTLQELEDI